MIPSKKIKKEEAQPLAAVDASTVAGFSHLPSTDIIEEPEQKVKASKPKNAKMPKNLGGLTMDSKVPDLAIKIYEEQLPDGLEAFFERVRSVDKSDYWVFSIVHDRDLVGDEIFEPACVKRHIHIDVVKQGKDQDGRADRRKVSTILNMLGIVFRPDKDAEIWANHGVERISDLGASVAYLTHETPDCEKKGKELYARAEIVSNLDSDEVDQVRDGYKRLTKSKHKATVDEQIKLAQVAYNAGYAGDKSWREFVATLPFLLQKGSVYNLYRERYQLGVDDRMKERSEVLRLCVFIKGEANQGKTYAAKHAFDGRGFNIVEIGDGGKTGKFDNITEDVDVLVIDDAIVHDVLGMADNKVCRVYRRNGFNPYWCGEYFIVTSNLSFEDWAKYCGVTDRTMDAAKSRFFICDIVEQGDGQKFLHCPLDCASRRGKKEQVERRRDMFYSFRDKFEEIINQYRPDNDDVDWRK